jgi:aspartate/methionine/tyrosine aminotransferase
MTRGPGMPSRWFAERYDGLLAIGGHPAVDMPPHVVEAAARAAERPAYAPTLGAPALREALAGLHGTTPDCVLVTVGGMQALHLVAQVYGARAVSHAPAFFFPQVVEAAGGSCKIAYDWDEYAAAVDRETTLAIVNTPVNPTGYVFRPSDLAAIAAALAGSDALLVSDEAFFGLLYDGLEHLSPTSHPDLRDRTVVLRSFSKTHAMAAWRVGYAVGPRETIAELARAFAWQALAVDAVAQAAALAALTGPQDWIEAARAELAEMRPRAVAAANATGVLRAGLPEGAAFVWAKVDGDEEAWSDRLAREHGITALPGRHFHARTPHLRIPFGGRPEAREVLLERLACLGHGDAAQLLGVGDQVDPGDPAV